jgi:hypothetical protein
LSCRSGLVDYDLGGYSLGGRIVARMLARGATPTRAIVGRTGLEPIIYAAGRGSRYREILANFGTFDPGSIEWQIEQFVTQVGGDPGRAGQRPWHVRRHAAGGAGAGRSSDARRGGRRRRSARLCPGACGLLPDGRYAPVPGDHISALMSPELAVAIVDFLGPPN